MSDEDDTEGMGEEKKGPGRPRKELPEIGDNSMTALSEDIKKAVSDIAQHQKDRESINQKVQAIREDLYAKGIPKEAFDLSLKYAGWPEDKRRNFDLAFAICREATGFPMQRDLFDNLPD
jgi:hypothetical protein